MTRARSPFVNGIWRPLLVAAVLAFSGIALSGCAAPGSRQPITRAPEDKPPPPMTSTGPILPQRPVDGKFKVALLLPLTGNNADVGKAMREAAEMALFDSGRQDLQLVPIDTGDTAEGAVAAAQAAVAQNVQLIFGPLYGSSTTAIAPVARSAGIPVFSFSNDPGVAGNGVYIMGFTVHPQVVRVTEYAIEKGLTRLAVLAPNTNYGQNVAQIVQEVAQARGAQVVAVEFFDAAATDVTPAVTNFAAAARNAQAIIVPIGGARLSAVVPLLAYRDLDPRKVKYLGTGLWDVPNIWRESALIGAWYAAPAPEARADFERRYNESYQRRPLRLATLAYDAVALSAALAKAGDFSSPALTNPNGFTGVDGLFRFLPNGQIERGLAVIEIGRTDVRTIAPAPNSFQRPSN